MLHMTKTRMLQIIKMLLDANESFINLIQQQVAGLPELLGKCQELAIVLGTELEKRGEVGLEIVSILENYCENIYQISLHAEDVESCETYRATIRQELGQVADMVFKKLPDKKEMVFFPYKAAMWDSLESVWKAASEDENVYAYVVPIPYFDKNEAGEFTAFHYEGDMFPSYVPIVSWEEYKLAERQPDVAYIHNPYDDWNVVTTVHPDFYASQIKKYAKELIYIPYFVHQNDYVAEHYCYLPGTFYADKVVLQSKKVQEQYIKYFAERAGIEDLASLEEKFVPWGSPKFDAQSFNTEIPEDWKPFLENPDKKVVFFNTHLSGIMRESCDDFLAKLEWVFDLIKNQDSVVWLWRPHPLTLETIHAMNPEVEKAYLALVEQYKTEKIGIYDDTPDLHRAIDLSDAYYGSASSVAEIFRQAGKPVMYMDIRIRD